MKRTTLSRELNIAFFVALFVPMVFATAYSIVYYGDKIKEEALNKVASDLKVAMLIYNNNVDELEQLAGSYSQERSLAVLFSLGLNEKLAGELSKTAKASGLDMVLAINRDLEVVARSHNSERYGDVVPNSTFIEQALQGKTLSSTEILPLEMVQQEGVQLQDSQADQILSLTGAAPLYDRSRTKIVGVLVLRRVINGDNLIVGEIYDNLNVDTGIFAQGHLIASHMPSSENNELQRLTPLIEKTVLEEGSVFEEAVMQENGYLAKYEPLRNVDGTPVGVMMIRTSAESYIETRFIAFTSLFVIALVGFLLAFSIKIVIQKRILLPIQKLKQGTEVIARGSYDHQMPILYQNELGDLAHSFNRMAGELADTYAKLEEYNRELEVKVEERTSELVQTNRQMAETNQLLGETLETLNPGVSVLISKNKQHLGLVVATEFITDLAGYTRLNMTIGESLTGEFITEFFRDSHKLLAKYFGFRDKTIGDQIVATFGIPKDESPPSPFHPFDSVFCALQMKEGVAGINEKLRRTIRENYSTIQNRLMSLPKEDREGVNLEGLQFQIRIGINTSNPATGREIDQMRMVMMGAETGVDYTGQGGALIYASRLESSGTPGEIHVGENTKRYIEHVFELEELPTVQLKGLGVQSRYRVIASKNLFANIYPKTRFFRRYSNNEPAIITNALKEVKIGKLHIHEVRKIQSETDVSIHYMEHCAGVYQVVHARSLFSYAIAEEMGLPDEVKNAIVFACIWHNRLPPHMYCFDFKEYDLEPQLPPDVDITLVNRILKELKKRLPNQFEVEMHEAQIIDIATRFDLLSFDRTYLRTRQNEVQSPRQVIETLHETCIYPEEMIQMLDSLMSTSIDAEEEKQEMLQVAGQLAGNTDTLIQFLNQMLTEEQKAQLLRKVQETS